MAPGEEIAHGFLGDEALVHEHPQHLGSEEAFEVAGVEAWQVMEAPVRAEAAIGGEEVDVWVKVEQLARGLEETHGAGSYVSAIDEHFEVELESSPGAGGELAQKLAVVAEEEAEPLGDGEDHLTVGDVFEQLLLGPGRPQQLPLLMTDWAPGKRSLLWRPVRPIHFRLCCESSQPTVTSTNTTLGVSSCSAKKNICPLRPG